MVNMVLPPFMGIPKKMSFDFENNAWMAFAESVYFICVYASFTASPQIEGSISLELLHVRFSF